ncbi:hypothetical protein B0T17DRAFT_234180 [Bombardia bombarda]|uniref:Uncharacterized protein n=1 Tax=Bombardia bombarda TaxID=252184 RepID=A0AA39XBI7_9PEZI|nr:hypothetical protein B0T17DRAFT_234180 [Bombardia bombarda]
MVCRERATFEVEESTNLEAILFKDTENTIKSLIDHSQNLRGIRHQITAKINTLHTDLGGVETLLQNVSNWSSFGLRSFTHPDECPEEHLNFILEAISVSHRPMVKNALVLLSHAFRPVSHHELVAALMCEDEKTDILLDSLGGLLQVNGEHVQFVHPKLRSYLLGSPKSSQAEHSRPWYRIRRS